MNTRRTHRGLRTVVMMVLALGLMTVTAFASGEEAAEAGRFYQTIWSLLPPVIAIGLALITKEVYSSLFIGILAGGLLYSGFSFEGTMQHVFVAGKIGQLTDSWNMGILIFLVVLGAMVILMNRAGGSAACEQASRCAACPGIQSGAKACC